MVATRSIQGSEAREKCNVGLALTKQITVPSSEAAGDSEVFCEGVPRPPLHLKSLDLYLSTSDIDDSWSDQEVRKNTTKQILI